MKLVLSSKDLLRVSIVLDTGEINCSIAGKNKNYGGKLSPEELQQIAYCVASISKGEIAFDPQPEDVLGRLVREHAEDVETLEKQAAALEQLRQELSDSLTERAELKQRLADCERDLVEARTKLKDVIAEQQVEEAPATQSQPPIVEESAQASA